MSHVFIGETRWMMADSPRQPLGRRTRQRQSVHTRACWHIHSNRVTVSVLGATALSTNPQSESALRSGTTASLTRPACVRPFAVLAVPGFRRRTFVVEAFAASRPPTHVSSISTCSPGLPTILIPHHASAELVENAEGRLIARQAKLSLKLCRASGWRPNKPPKTMCSTAYGCVP